MAGAQLDWVSLVNTAGILGALGVGAYQLRRSVQDARERDRERRVERALELYRDLVGDGETARAFHRLSVFLRDQGAKDTGGWYLLKDSDFTESGLLSPEDPRPDAPFADLYRVMWFFERVLVTTTRGLVDRDVWLETIGFHCWWWGQLLRQLKAPKAAAALHQLAMESESWSREAERRTTDSLQYWASHCQEDFGGGPPIELTSCERAL